MSGKSFHPIYYSNSTPVNLSRSCSQTQFNFTVQRFMYAWQKFSLHLLLKQYTCEFEYILQLDLQSSSTLRVQRYMYVWQKFSPHLLLKQYTCEFEYILQFDLQYRLILKSSEVHVCLANVFTPFTVHLYLSRSYCQTLKKKALFNSYYGRDNHTLLVSSQVFVCQMCTCLTSFPLSQCPQLLT